jgi:hypothetical protein
LRSGTTWGFTAEQPGDVRYQLKSLRLGGTSPAPRSFYLREALRRKEGLVNEITTRIVRYRKGEETWDSLFTWLTTKKYPDPERYKTYRDATKEEDWYGDDDGTWDEVSRACNYGLLTQDEYHKILVEMDRLAGR